MNTFAKDVKDGLSSSPKHLSSKYFYDAIGDDLFVKITQMPEYYLTKAENEIFDLQVDDIIKAMDIEDIPVEIIELGAGDGHKAVQFLQPLKDHAHLTFIPVDISMNALVSVEDRFQDELPEIDIQSEQGEYFAAIKELNGHRKKVVLFLGSNIGNLSEDEANDFMSQLSDSLNPGDKVLLGVDLKKSPEVILPAYDDKDGITRDFNLNLLRRINNELGGNFDLDQFSHDPEYDMLKGEAKSYLTSLTDQEVNIEELNRKFKFQKGEKIHTEISQKYDDEKVKRILCDSGMRIQQVFKDSRQYFADYLIEKI